MRDTSSPPCLKGRKQRERREDVSDLAEGSPGLTLKPGRLNGPASPEDERGLPPRWQGRIGEETLKRKQADGDSGGNICDCVERRLDNGLQKKHF